MKICSLTILHYGADYLSYALRSVYDSVDECHVFFTPTPSHSHSTDIEPPETRETLLKAAFSHDPDNKIIWYDVENVRHEGHQRDGAQQIIKRSGADLVVVVDCDEIWPDGVLGKFLSHVWRQNSHKNYLVNMRHFWRSFNYVCDDDGWPVRIMDLRHEQSEQVEYLDREIGQVLHFGYAIRDEIMRYKWLIHGHKSEMRRGWLRDKWFGWNTGIGDVHPTNDNQFWMPKPFDKNGLPNIMKAHPFYNLDMIR